MKLSLVCIEKTDSPLVTGSSSSSASLMPRTLASVRSTLAAVPLIVPVCNLGERRCPDGREMKRKVEDEGDCEAKITMTRLRPPYNIISILFLFDIFGPSPPVSHPKLTMTAMARLDMMLTAELTRRLQL